MLSSEPVKAHRSRMDTLRNNLKCSPIMRKATLPLETKIEKSKLRKKSANLETAILGQ